MEPVTAHIPMMTDPTADELRPKPTLREVFESEESPLLGYAYGLVGQRETAEDLVQEAFLKLHAHWQEVESPRAWLFRAVRNLALNHLRDHSREISSPPESESADTTRSPDEALGHLEALGTLRMLVAELPAADQHLIHLKYHQNLKYEQISKHTGISVGNIGYKLHHALKSLADGLRNMGVDGAN